MSVNFSEIVFWNAHWRCILSKVLLVPNPPTPSLWCVRRLNFEIHPVVGRSLKSSTFVWLGKAKRLSLCRENSNTNVTALLVNLYIPLSCQIQSPLNDNPSCFAFSALIEGSMADLGRGAGKQQETWISWAIGLYISPAVRQCVMLFNGTHRCSSAR